MAHSAQFNRQRRDRFWFRLHHVMAAENTGTLRISVQEADNPFEPELEEDYKPQQRVAPKAEELPGGYEWYYVGTLFAMGFSPKGNDFEFDLATGKVSRATSVNERKRICEYGKRYGDKRAAEKFEVPPGTIQVWRNRATAARRPARRQTSQTLTA